MKSTRTNYPKTPQENDASRDSYIFIDNRDKMTDMVKHLILKVLSSSQDQTVARSKGAFGPITSRLSLRELRQKDP